MSNDSKKDFPWYCSYGGPIGIAACPRKDLPWYCYMGAVGKKRCVDEGLLDDDLATKVVGGAEHVIEGAADAISNIDTILTGVIVVGGAVGLLWAAKTIKELRQ